MVTCWLAVVGPAAVDTLVVCPEPLRPALAPWIEYRTQQGHQIELVSARGEAAEIRERLRRAADGQPIAAVLLVGDTDIRGRVDEPKAFYRLPTFYETSKVVVQYGSEPTIASDNRYGDFDDDGLPDVAVGRLPVDTPEELKRVVAKIIAYEQAIDHDGWRRRIHFIAGTSGMGAIADAVIESSTKKLLCEHIPPGYSTTMTYANWQSPYCPDPIEFRTTTIKRFNEGGLFWVYLGHGHVQLVDFLHVPGDRHPVFDVFAMSRLARRESAPIALFFACYTGAFDARQDCLAEEMLKAEGGAVAVVAASRVTMPYGMSVLGLELMDEHFQQRRATIGAVLMHAKRDSVLASRDDARAKAVDGMARILNPLGPDLSDERREHVKLFHLLGDPLLRVPQLHHAELDTPSQVTAGGWLDVAGTCTLDGTAEVELAVRRDRLPITAPNRSQYDSTGAGRGEFTELYYRVNEQRQTRQTTQVSQGRFQTRLFVPPQLRGACHVRVFVTAGRESALGAKEIEISAPTGDALRTAKSIAGEPR